MLLAGTSLTEKLIENTEIFRGRMTGAGFTITVRKVCFTKT